MLGGCEEFEESRPTCRRNASNSTRNASINTACSATSAANSAYEGVTGGSDTDEVKHDQTVDPSTDTPQVSQRSDWLPQVGPGQESIDPGSGARHDPGSTR